MSTEIGASTRQPVRLPYFSVRNISCPEDAENDRKVYVGYTPVTAIVGLSTHENVRDYLLEAEGRQRRRQTQVHKAIEDTLKNNPGNFSVLNSGAVIVARDCTIDERDKVLVLKGSSIINGSQTQGVIRDCYAKALTDPDVAPPHIKFELIVTDDEDLIADISIARNLQDDVMSISIAGRLGQLDDLERSLQSSDPKAKLQKSETKLSTDYVKTERLLQVITALIPESLWPKPEFNKVYAYSMKAKCLKEFRDLHDAAKKPDHPEHSQAKELYQFYLDIAAQALALYGKWKRHQGFQGTGLRSIEREADGRTIKDVPDGMIFPILSALSAFAKKDNGRWVIEPPALFNDEELIRAAKGVYMDIANSNPWNMGKSKSCYASLYQITSIYEKLSRSVVS